MAAAEDTIHDVGTGDGNARIPIVYHGAYAPYSAQQPGAGRGSWQPATLFST